MNYLEYQEYKDYLCHHGVKGMKWGVRRYQNKDGSLTAAGKKRKQYIDEDGALTSSGKKQIKKLNELDSWDNQVRVYKSAAERNVERFSSRNGKVSEALSKLNKRYVSDYDEVISQNKEKINAIIADLKSQKVDVVLRYDPYADKMYYKQSDKQKVQAEARKSIGEELKRNDELMKKYAIASKIENNPARNPYYKSVDKSNEKLTRKTEEYLSTLERDDVKKLIKRDTEHGNYYVDRKVFDPSIDYDDYVSISDDFAKRYKK